MSKYIKKNKKKAFTLVEILIVVAVIGILFVALVPRIDFAGDKARETAVKNDFRSFELAAEQYLREKAGIEISDKIGLYERDTINMYLDNALKFDEDGVCTKNDPWNTKYTVQVIKPESGNYNNGALVFICNGKDGKLRTVDDNYTVTVMYYDGEIRSATEGFSSNVESGIYTVGTPWPKLVECANSEFIAYYKW